MFEYDWLHNIVYPALGAVIAIAVAIGWYRAKFAALCKRVHELEKKVKETEHNTWRKMDKMSTTLIEVKTIVELLAAGKIKTKKDVSP